MVMSIGGQKRIEFMENLYFRLLDGLNRHVDLASLHVQMLLDEISTMGIRIRSGGNWNSFIDTLSIGILHMPKWSGRLDLNQRPLAP